MHLLLNPYDGNSIGSFKPDKMQKITGSIYFTGGGAGGVSLSSYSDQNGALRPVIDAPGGEFDIFKYSTTGGRGVALDSSKSPNARTGDETAPVSISVLFCIYY
jgi:hypothetical protein